MSDLFGLLVAPLQVPGTLGAAGHDLLPAVLDAGQEVPDQNHVLLLTEVLQVGPRLVQGNHSLPVLANVLLENLWSINFESKNI